MNLAEMFPLVPKPPSMLRQIMLLNNSQYLGYV